MHVAQSIEDVGPNLFDGRETQSPVVGLLFLFHESSEIALFHEFHQYQPWLLHCRGGYELYLSHDVRGEERKKTKAHLPGLDGAGLQEGALHSPSSLDSCGVVPSRQQGHQIELPYTLCFFVNNVRKEIGGGGE